MSDATDRAAGFRYNQRRPPSSPFLARDARARRRRIRTGDPQLATKMIGREQPPDANKSFHGFVLAKAMADGVVSVDDSADRYLPAPLKVRHSAITLRSLVTNTSGLPNFPENQTERAWARRLAGVSASGGRDSSPGADNVNRTARTAPRPRSKHFFIFAYAGESVLDLTCVVRPE